MISYPDLIGGHVEFFYFIVRTGGSMGLINIYSHIHIHDTLDTFFFFVALIIIYKLVAYVALDPLETNVFIWHLRGDKYIAFNTDTTIWALIVILALDSIPYDPVESRKRYFWRFLRHEATIYSHQNQCTTVKSIGKRWRIRESILSNRTSVR
jgi:hypothetical protein